MARITEVAQGVFQISVMNVAVTLVLDGDRVVLLDAGLRTTPAHVLAFLDARGLRPQQVSHILVSHYHPDHIGGLRRLRELTGCSGIVPEFSNVACADRIVRDSETIELGDIRITALATPGHTDSHMAYRVNDDRVLTGDALFIRG